MIAACEQRIVSPATSPLLSHPVGVSDQILELCRCAYRYASTTAPVLLTGESGTGKEVFARFIHQTSPRSTRNYVRINCAAISESLFESELFGHERGAFTGAFARRVGCFESANGGTLLLDEISEIPLRLQAKLLRVLEESEFNRVGGNEPQPIDVRILATSNRCLETAVRRKKFRADLFYRLNVLPITVPPLRERPADLPPLVHYFIDQFRPESPADVSGIATDAMEKLRRYDWPGNVRQLRNVIRRACIIAENEMIALADIEELTKKEDSRTRAKLRHMKLKEVERVMIMSSLRCHHGNKTAAARHLGITRRTLLNKLNDYKRKTQSCTDV